MALGYSVASLRPGCRSNRREGGCRCNENLTINECSYIFVVTLKFGVNIAVDMER